MFKIQLLDFSNYLFPTLQYLPLHVSKFCTDIFRGNDSLTTGKFGLIFVEYNIQFAGHCVRAVERVGVRPLACWNCGFESHRVMDVRLLWMLCVSSGRGLCDELIKRPIDCYGSFCVWSRNLVNDESLAHRGTVVPKTNNIYFVVKLFTINSAKYVIPQEKKSIFVLISHLVITWTITRDEPFHGKIHFNLLKPNDIYIYIYICRTAALNSRRYILNIYSTNIHTEYFKHAA